MTKATRSAVRKRRVTARVGIRAKRVGPGFSSCQTSDTYILGETVREFGTSRHRFDSSAFAVQTNRKVSGWLEKMVEFEKCYVFREQVELFRNSQTTISSGTSAVEVAICLTPVARSRSAASSENLQISTAAIAIDRGFFQVLFGSFLEGHRFLHTSSGES